MATEGLYGALGSIFASSAEQLYTGTCTVEPKLYYGSCGLQITQDSTMWGQAYGETPVPKPKPKPKHFYDELREEIDDWLQIAA